MKIILGIMSHSISKHFTSTFHVNVAMQDGTKHVFYENINLTIG